MADSTINGLSSGTTPLAGTEELPIWQSSSTVKVTVQDIADLAGGDNLGNADLTSDAATRKFILNGDLSSDYLTIRDGSDTTDILKVQGDDIIRMNKLGINNVPSASYPVRFKTTSGISAVQVESTAASGNGISIITTGVSSQCFKIQNNGTNTPDGIEINMSSNAAVKTGVDLNMSGTGSNIGLDLDVSGGSNNYAVLIRNGDFRIPASSDEIINGSGTHKKILGGALSTDEFVIRNSADTLDFFKVLGTGVIEARGVAGIATNVSIGSASADATTTGNNNVAIGSNALTTNTTSSRNVAIGTSALQTKNGGFGYATAIGYSSLSVATGDFNTAVGYQSGLNNSSGQYNQYFGVNVGHGITTGSYNTIIGASITGLGASTANNVILADGQFNTALWKDANHYVGFGYDPTSDTLGATVDIKAQGALSTDLPLRVRNSADTKNLLKVDGTGTTTVESQGITDKMLSLVNGGNEFFKLQTAGSSTDPSQAWQFDSCRASAQYALRFKNSDTTMSFQQNNLIVGALPTASLSERKSILIGNGTAPSSSTLDHTHIYSADESAGNACFHTRTEGGDVIKLYKEAGLTASDGTLANAVTRIGEIETALQNLGLLT